MDLKRNIVENTNDCSIVSKYSMCKKGYAFDEYLKYFVSKEQQKRNRCPLINRFYYIRFKAIEYAFNNCNELNQIISIGCGFDTSSLRFPSISFIEIDFPIVAINKAKILIDNQLIENDLIQTQFNTNSNEPFIILRTNNYCLIGADLRKYDTIHEFFIKQNLLKTVNRDTKIGLFNECSLCYLKQNISDNIIKVFYELYNRISDSITYIGFEQLKSNLNNNGFSSVMLSHFETIGSPLMTFINRSQIIDRFKTLNFDSIDILDMKTFYDNYIDEKEKQRIDCLEMFDEFEEFDSVCNLYGLTIAKTNHKSNHKSNDFNDTAFECLKASHEIKPIYKSINESPLLSRFGHTSCLTNDNQIVIFGGFGLELNSKQQSFGRNTHKRLSNVIKVNTETDQIINYNVCDKLNTNERIHSKIIQLEENLFLVSGGRTSPSVVLDNKLIKLMPDMSYAMQSIAESESISPKVFRHLFLKLINTNKIVQLGGKQSNRSLNNIKGNDYYILDTNLMQWQKRNISKMNCNIHSHSGISLDSNVFISSGGLTCDTNSFTSTDIYLFDDRMQTINQIKVQHLDHIYSHNIKSLNQNKVLIIGGITKSGVNNKIDLLDLRSNKVIDSMVITTDSPLMLHNFSSELITNESPLLWMIGGGGNCFSFGTHFNKLSVVEIFLK